MKWNFWPRIPIKIDDEVLVWYGGLNFDIATVKEVRTKYFIEESDNYSPISRWRIIKVIS